MRKFLKLEYLTLIVKLEIRRWLCSLRKLFYFLMFMRSKKGSKSSELVLTWKWKMENLKESVSSFLRSFN